MNSLNRGTNQFGGDYSAKQTEQHADKQRWKLLDALNQASSEYGFRDVIVADINKNDLKDPRQKIVATNLVGELFYRFGEIFGSHQCPLLTRGKHSVAPFSWDAQDIVNLTAKDSGHEHRSRSEMSTLLHEHEIGGGCSVPVRGIGGQALMVIYCGTNACAGIRFPELTQTTFETIDSYFSQNQSAEPAAQRLTNRETECLAWVAEGKTSGELAEIVGLSEHTVNHYLLSATKKLNSVNRTQAVVKALRLGII